MATIRQRTRKSGKTVWDVMVRMKGSPQRSGTFHKLADAKRWAAKVEAEIRHARYFGNVPSGEATVADAIDRFYEERLSDYSAHDQRARRRILGWWRDRIGHIRLSQLRSDMFSGALRDLKAEGYSDSTQNHYIAAISKVLTLCTREWQLAAVNPARNVTRRRLSNNRVRFLSVEEKVRLLRECKASRSPMLYPIVMFALCTGARRGEIIALLWEDVSLERATATFRNTKNKSDRTVPLSPPAIEVLRGIERRSARVFGPDQFPREAWDHAVARCELKNFRFHDIRHTAASYLAMTGATQVELAEMLGHKTLIMVKRYAHLSESHLAELAGKMADKFVTQLDQDESRATD